MEGMKALCTIGVATAVLSVMLVGDVSGQAGSTSPRVQAALTELERAATFEQVAQALKRASLSKAEQDQLQAALPKALGQKIERLARAARLAGKARAGQRVALSAQRLEFHTRQVETRLARVHSQARSSVQAALAQARASAARRPISGPALATFRPPAAAVTGSIRSVTPSPAVVGQAITINGDGFGPAPGGRLLALFGPDDRVECPVTNWSANRIVATLPLTLEDRVHEGSRSGFVRVVLAGGGNGPWAEVTFAPDLGRLTPVITGVDPDPIVDSFGEVVLQGRNFLATERGTVTLSYPDNPELPSEIQRIEEWTDTAIVLAFTPLSCGPSRVSYKVRNHLGREGSASFRFQPTTRVMLVNGSEHEKHCELWVDGNPSIFCLVGKKETVAVKVGCNCGSSQILDAGFDELDSGGLGFGKAWKTEPRANRFEGSYEIWADAYSWIEVRPWFVVEVPRIHECFNAAP